MWKCRLSGLLDNEGIRVYTGNHMSKMKPHPIKMPDSLWNKAVKKSGITPVAAVVRRLLDMWIKGEISLENSQSVQDENQTNS